MDSVLHLLGLARKGGNLALGEEPVKEACARKTARLVLVACDAAENTAQQAARLAGAIPCLEAPWTKEELGSALGRSSCAVLALTDAGLAGAVAGGLARRDEARYGPAAALLREKARRTLKRKKAKQERKKARQKAARRPWAAPPKGPGGPKAP